jgi:hypothetical protein
MSTNTSNKENSTTTTPSSFSFKYVESGGLANNYLVISFDSESNNIKVSADISGANLTQKSIEDSEKNTLIDTIKKIIFIIQMLLMLRKRKMKIIRRFPLLLQLQ